MYELLRQLGRAVKAIDSKSIGVTRVSSSLTAVDLFAVLLRVAFAASDARFGPSDALYGMAAAGHTLARTPNASAVCVEAVNG